MLQHARAVAPRDVASDRAALEADLARAYAAAGDTEAAREHAEAGRTLFVEAGGRFDDERAELDALLASL